MVFTGHSSLRFGDASVLLSAWKKDPKNALIITGLSELFIYQFNFFLETEYDIKRLLTVYEPISMKIHNIPIDRRLR